MSTSNFYEFFLLYFKFCSLLTYYSDKRLPQIFCDPLYFYFYPNDIKIYVLCKSVAKLIGKRKKSQLL